MCIHASEHQGGKDMNLNRKIMVFTIICLFMGAGVFPSIDSAGFQNIRTLNDRSFLSDNRGWEGLTFDGYYLWVAQSNSLKINKLDRNSQDILTSYDSPGTYPRGLAWDGENLWLADYNEDVGNYEIFKINPSNGSVIHNYTSPCPVPSGLTWAGNVLWVSDMDIEKIYKCKIVGSGSSSELQVITWFSSPGDSSERDPTGLAWDGTHLWLADRHYDEIYTLNPVNMNVLCTFESPGLAPRGLAWDGTYLWNADLNSGILKLDFQCDPPNRPGKPYGPTTGFINQNYTYNISTTDPNNDMIKYGWDWDGDNVIDEWTDYYPSGETVSTTHSWSDVSTYHIKAIAEDTSKAQSSWSDSLTVVISINNPPNKPNKPSGITSGKTGISYTYSTNTIDPDDDLVKYGWDWNGNDSVDEWTGLYSSGEIISIPHTWEEEGNYSIKVKVEDEHGLESEWSDPLPVTMPKTKSYINIPFIYFLKQHPHLFPLLQKLLGLEV